MSLATQHIADRVLILVAEHLGLDVDYPIAQSSLLTDLGADSLDALDILMAINEFFHVHIPGEELINIHSVQDLIDRVVAAAQRGSE